MKSFAVLSSRFAVAAGIACYLACSAEETDTGSRENEHSDLAYGFSAPGNEPELFAFDVLGNEHAQLAPAMAPGGNELYFGQIRLGDEGMALDLMHTRFVDGEWSDPQPAPVATEHGELEAFFNSSGNRLYFFSRRPIDNPVEQPIAWNLWYIEMAHGDWGQPQLLGQPRSSLVFNWSANLLDDTTLYFTARPYEEPGLAEIFEVSIAGGVFGEPATLGPAINTREYTENEPVIAPDGSYMIFYSAGRPDNLSEELLGDLYISFRNESGGWNDAVRLDEPINSTAEENWPRISPDGRFLFFSSNRREGVELPDIYWVSTRALEPYRTR